MPDDGAHASDGDELNQVNTFVAGDERVFHKRRQDDLMEDEMDSLNVFGSLSGGSSFTNNASPPMFAHCSGGNQFVPIKKQKKVSSHVNCPKKCGGYVTSDGGSTACKDQDASLGSKYRYKCSCGFRWTQNNKKAYDALILKGMDTAAALDIQPSFLKRGPYKCKICNSPDKKNCPCRSAKTNKADSDLMRDIGHLVDGIDDFATFSAPLRPFGKDDVNGRNNYPDSPSCQFVNADDTEEEDLQDEKEDDEEKGDEEKSDEGKGNQDEESEKGEDGKEEDEDDFESEKEHDDDEKSEKEHDDDEESEEEEDESHLVDDEEDEDEEESEEDEEENDDNDDVDEDAIQEKMVDEINSFISQNKALDEVRLKVEAMKKLFILSRTMAKKEMSRNLCKKIVDDSYNSMVSSQPSKTANFSLPAGMTLFKPYTPSKTKVDINSEVVISNGKYQGISGVVLSFSERGPWSTIKLSDNSTINVYRSHLVLKSSSSLRAVTSATSSFTSATTTPLQTSSSLSPPNGKYTLRKGTTPYPSDTGEKSWVMNLNSQQEFKLVKNNTYLSEYVKKQPKFDTLEEAQFACKKLNGKAGGITFEPLQQVEQLEKKNDSDFGDSSAIALRRNLPPPVAQSPGDGFTAMFAGRIAGVCGKPLPTLKDAMCIANMLDSVIGVCSDNGQWFCCTGHRVVDDFKPTKERCCFVESKHQAWLTADETCTHKRDCPCLSRKWSTDYMQCFNCGKMKKRGELIKGLWYCGICADGMEHDDHKPSSEQIKLKKFEEQVLFCDECDEEGGCTEVHRTCVCEHLGINEAKYDELFGANAQVETRYKCKFHSM